MMIIKVEENNRLKPNKICEITIDVNIPENLCGKEYLFIML